ncbi:type II toxin-antitoxin system HicB family antitoxin [bacterium]|nr:type II toxin-antitoxin system HicB family antitoxin [bacterium]
MKKEIERLASVHYTFRVEKLESGEFYIAVPELPGCYATGETLNEAIEALYEAKYDWIHAAASNSIPIPQPAPSSCEKSYSGQILLRMPKGLHRKLSETSNEECVSLNQYMVYLLAEGLTKKTTARQLIKENFSKLQPKWENRSQTILKYPKSGFIEAVEKQLYSNGKNLSREYKYDCEKTG